MEALIIVRVIVFFSKVLLMIILIGPMRLPQQVKETLKVSWSRQLSIKLHLYKCALRVRTIIPADNPITEGQGCCWTKFRN